MIFQVLQLLDRPMRFRFVHFQHFWRSVFNELHCLLSVSSAHFHIIGIDRRTFVSALLQQGRGEHEAKHVILLNVWRTIKLTSLNFLQTPYQSGFSRIKSLHPSCGTPVMTFLNTPLSSCFQGEFRHFCTARQLCKLWPNRPDRSWLKGLGVGWRRRAKSSRNCKIGPTEKATENEFVLQQSGKWVI